MELEKINTEEGSATTAREGGEIINRNFGQVGEALDNTVPKKGDISANTSKLSDVPVRIPPISGSTTSLLLGTLWKWISDIVSGALAVGKAEDANRAEIATKDDQGNIIRDTYATKTEVDQKVVGIYRFKGSIQNIAALLALTGVKRGDVYDVREAGTLNGQLINSGDNIAATADNPTSAQWDNLAGKVDLSNYLQKTGDASDTTVIFVQESGEPTSGGTLHSIIGRIARKIADIVSGAIKVGNALKADAATVDGAGNNIVAQYAAKTGTYPNMTVGDAQKFAGMNTLETGLLNIGTYPGDIGHSNNYVELISDIADTENVMFVMRLTGGSYSFGYVLDLTLMGYAYKDGSLINISSLGGYNTWWNNPLANTDKIFAYMRGGKLCIAVQVPEVYSRLSGAIYAGKDAIMVNRIMGATQRSHDYILNTAGNNIKWTVKPSTASLAVVDGGTYDNLTVGRAVNDENGNDIPTTYLGKAFTYGVNIDPNTQRDNGGFHASGANIPLGFGWAIAYTLKCSNVGAIQFAAQVNSGTDTKRRIAYRSTLSERDGTWTDWREIVPKDELPGVTYSADPPANPKNGDIWIIPTD